jgi:hypothetical protein
MSDRRRGPWLVPVGILVGLLLAVVAPATSAFAQPGDTAGDEGGTPTLASVLDSTARAFLDAQQALDASKKRQAEITDQATRVETELKQKSGEAQGIASTAYRAGTLSAATALLESKSPDRFLDRATVLQSYATRNDHKLRELNRLRKELADARNKINAEVSLQEQQVATMAQKKQEAEKALAEAGGRTSGGFVSATSPVAQPAPRRPDGTWPPERCTIDDPTTTGCITPRMLHAMQQAQAAGFTKFVSCFRPSGPYEHPKGRACDFSASAKGFAGVGGGGAPGYGSKQAAD